MKNRMRNMFRGCVLGFFLMGCLGATLQAAPMFGETMEFRQPDGTEVPVVLFGDEFYMRGETPDGYTVLRDPDTGWICYAELSADGSELVPTQERYLNALTPAGLMATGAALSTAGGTTREKGVQLSTERLLEKVRDVRERMGADEFYADAEPSPDTTPAKAAATTTETDPMPEAAASTGLPVRVTDPSLVSGTITGLVVVVDFSDEPAPYTLQQYEDKCNKEGYYDAKRRANSLRTFYQDASGGKFDMVQIVKGVYRAPKTFAEYDAMGFADGAKEILRFVLQQLEDEGFDFSQLTIDDDDDGTVQLVSIMYPGNAQSWAEGMWHHSHFITGNNIFGGVKFSSYVTSKAGSLSPGTMCHEYGHMAARWPDTYAYSGGAGVWGLMGGVETRLPNPYLLYRNSWLDLENVFGLDGTFQMDSLDPHHAYVYYDPSHPDEYFIMRPYTKNLLECANIPEEGMTIWRVNNDGSNSGFPDRPLLVDLVKADNHQPETSSGVCFSKFGVLDHYTPYTESSSAWRYHGLEYQDSGFQMLNVSAVDSNMTFDLSNDPAPPKHTVRGGSTALFVDTFERIGGNDVDVVGVGMSGQLVTPKDELYYEGYEGSGSATSIQVLDGRLRMAVGNGMSENGIGHNFIDPEILTAGGFSVQLDVNEINSATPHENRYCGVGVGLSRDEAAAGASIFSGSSFRGTSGNEAGVSDFFVDLDLNGDIKVWRHGSLISTVPVGIASGTLRVDFSCSGFSMSDAVTVSVYFNGRAVDINADASTTQTFNWSSDHENYIGLSARAGNYAEMDNLKVSSLGQDGEVVLQTDFEAYETGGVAAWNPTGLVNVFPLGDDVGEGYYHAVGSQKLVSNPEANGNTSAQVLRAGSHDADVNQFSMNYSAGAVQINGMTLSYDFYNGTGANATDGVRVGLQNFDSTAGGFWIRNDRTGLIQINGTDIAEQNAGANVWQRFSGEFTLTEGGANTFDFAWTLTNLETTSVIASGTQSNQVLFATTEEMYSAGLTFEVYDVEDGGNFIGYLDHLEVTSPGQAGNLFYDSFARPDHTDVDADVGGISGSSIASILEEIASQMRPGDTYIEGYESGDESTTRLTERTLQMAYGPSMSEVALDHNFIDQDILAAGGFSVELKIGEMVTTDSDLHNRYGGFGVGLTQAEAESGNDINSEGSFRGNGDSVLGRADFFVELDMNGNVKVCRYGSLIATVPVGAASGTLTAGFDCSGFGSSDSVEVSVFFNGALLDINSGSGVTQTFTWQNGNANYIGLSARAAEVSFDYLAVRTLPLHSAVFAQAAFDAGLSADQADPDADSDGDGESNFSEWVLGSDMMVSNAPVKPIQLLGVTDSAFLFSQRRMVDAEYVGVRYPVSWSTNLLDWFDFVPAALGSVPVGGNAAYEQVELDVGSDILSGKDKLFIRGTIEP